MARVFISNGLPDEVEVLAVQNGKVIKQFVLGNYALVKDELPNNQSTRMYPLDSTITLTALTEERPQISFSVANLTATNNTQIAITRFMNDMIMTNPIAVPIEYRIPGNRLFVQIEDNIVYRVADSGQIVKTIGTDTFATFESGQAANSQPTRQPTPIVFMLFVFVFIFLIVIILFWILRAKYSAVPI
jgi:hypothetical protein